MDEQPASDRSGPRGTRWRHRIAANAEQAAREAAADRAVGRAERVVAATRALIGETGATSFTVQDIARRANVSLSTVYAYFAGKDELLVAVLEEAIRVAADRLQAQLAACHDPLDRLRTAVVGPLLYAAGPDRPADVPALSRERDRLGDLFPSETQAATDQLVDVLRAELATAARAGLVTPVDPERDATAIYHLWTTELRDLWRTGGFGEVEAAADYLWRLCCRFLRVPADPGPQRDPGPRADPGRQGHPGFQPGTRLQPGTGLQAGTGYPGGTGHSGGRPAGAEDGSAGDGGGAGRESGGGAGREPGRGIDRRPGR